MIDAEKNWKWYAIFLHSTSLRPSTNKIIYFNLLSFVVAALTVVVVFKLNFSLWKKEEEKNTHIHIS